MLFTIKVTYKGTTDKIEFTTNGRFPYFSDIQNRLREHFGQERYTGFETSPAFHVVWRDVLFYPNINTNARVMFKQYICDAAGFEEAQKYFQLSRFPSPGLSFTILPGSDDSLDTLRKKREGRKLVESAANLTTDCEKHERAVQANRDGLARYERKLQEAISAGRDYDIPIWSAQIRLVTKALDQAQEQLDACLAERVAISKQLDAPTLGYASFREFLEAEDTAETRLAQDTIDELDAWNMSAPFWTRAPSPSPYPPLDHILPPVPRRRREPDGYQAYSDEFGRNFQPPPDHIPRQPDIACALEAVATDFVPEIYRRDLQQSLQPARDMIHNAFDGPYQRLWNNAQQLGSTLRDMRDLPRPYNHFPYGQQPVDPNTVPRSALWEDEDEYPRASPFMDEWPSCAAGPSDYRRRVEPPVAAPPSRVRPPVAAPPPRVKPPVAKPPPRVVPPVAGPSVSAAKHFKHKSISCDCCLKSVKGLRFRCKQCPNYDLCHECLMISVNSGFHAAHHEFQLIAHDNLKRALGQNPSSSTTSMKKKDHPASCDICTKRISGVRIKCINCPDWDCCEDCTEATNRLHPGHTFVRLNEASDLVEPPYRMASKPKHANILCNTCDKTVCGDRWKCVHPDCADFDQCDNCQASPLNEHPRRHPILRLSEPIDVEFVTKIQGSVPKSAIARGKQPEGAQQSPPKRVRLDLPIINDVGTQSEPMEVDAGPADIPSPPAQEATPPGLIKCYTYEHMLAICPPKPDDDPKAADPPVETQRTPSPTSPTVITPTDGPSPSAIFTGVEDVTIPAGSRLPVGAEFTKTWTMQHLASGSDYSFDRLRLVHESGGLLGNKACKATIAFSANDIQSGSKIEVSLDGLKVPNMPEQQIIEQWRFRDVNGSAYGEPLRIRFTVENDLNNSLSHSSFIMPPIDHEEWDREVREVPEESPAPDSPASLAWTIDVPSPRVLYPNSFANEAQAQPELEDGFALVERSNSRQSHTTATSATDDNLDLDLADSEFDFVDESEDEAPSS